MGEYLQHGNHLMAGAINTALNKNEVYRLYEGNKAIHSLPQNLNEIIKQFKFLQTDYPKRYIDTWLEKRPKSYCFLALCGYVEKKIEQAKLNDNNKEKQTAVLENTLGELKASNSSLYKTSLPECVDKATKDEERWQNVLQNLQIKAKIEQLNRRWRRPASTCDYVVQHAETLSSSTLDALFTPKPGRWYGTSDGPWRHLSEKEQVNLALNNASVFYALSDKPRATKAMCRAFAFELGEMKSQLAHDFYIGFMNAVQAQGKRAAIVDYRGRNMAIGECKLQFEPKAKAKVAEIVNRLRDFTNNPVFKAFETDTSIKAHYIALVESLIALPDEMLDPEQLQEIQDNMPQGFKTYQKPQSWWQRWFGGGNQEAETLTSRLDDKVKSVERSQRQTPEKKIPRSSTGSMMGKLGGPSMSSEGQNTRRPKLSVVVWTPARKDPDVCEALTTTSVATDGNLSRSVSSEGGISEPELQAIRLM